MKTVVMKYFFKFLTIGRSEIHLTFRLCPAWQRTWNAAQFLVHMYPFYPTDKLFSDLGVKLAVEIALSSLPF